jgi:hypothetical protein
VSATATSEAVSGEHVLFEARLSEAHLAAFRMTLGLQLEEILAEEVRGIAWETGGRLGIQLADGSVAPVSYEFGLHPADLDGARAAVCAFVERATGNTWPQRDEPLDVAPWVVRKAQRPTA